VQQLVKEAVAAPRCANANNGAPPWRSGRSQGADAGRPSRRAGRRCALRRPDGASHGAAIRGDDGGDAVRGGWPHAGSGARHRGARAGDADGGRAAGAGGGGAPVAAEPALRAVVRRSRRRLPRDAVVQEGRRRAGWSPRPRPRRRRGGEGQSRRRRRTSLPLETRSRSKDRYSNGSVTVEDRKKFSLRSGGRGRPPRGRRRPRRAMSDTR